MKLWIVSVGEPLPIDSDNVRLRRMGNLAMYASSQGIDVEWFSVSFDHYGKKQRCQNDKDYKINEKFILHIVRVNGYKKNISLSRIIHHYNSGKNIYRKMNELEKPDIILASMEPLEVSKSVVRYSKKNNIPCIIDVRDLWPEIYYDVIPKYLHQILDIYVRICSRTLSYTMKNCTSIIGLSEGFLNYGLKYTNRGKNEYDSVFPIAYPNYDYNNYKDLLEKFWNKYGITKKDFIVTFLGNFGDQFKFDEIIETAKELRDYTDIKFILCGTGKRMDEIKSKVGNNVIIPGWIEKEEILSLLSNSKIGIAPYIDSMNYRLNTPNKFGEYLSAGLPILVSVSGEMEKLLAKNECGYCYNNSRILKEKILEYYNFKDKQQKHSFNARKLYEKMFDGNKINRELINYICKIINKYKEK